MFVYGAEDPWQPTGFMKAIIGEYRSEFIVGCGHEMSKKEAIARFWASLVW